MCPDVYLVLYKDDNFPEKYLEILPFRAANTHCMPVMKTSQLMLYREIIAVYSQILTH